MRLKHQNLKNMDLNLRSGAKARIDSEGCIEVDNEQDANILIATGWVAVAARSPRTMPGVKTGDDVQGHDPNAKLWPGGPTRMQVEDLRSFASETNDKLAEANNALADKDREIDVLKAEVAALKAAQAGPSTETPAGLPEGEKSASEGGSAPARKPKAPKPEADKG